MHQGKINFAIGIALLMGIVLTFETASAQSVSPLLVTWEANSYAPSDFRGKPLVPRGGTITASLDFLSAGKPVSLTNREVRWFVENELYQSGKNLKRITFSAPVQNSDSVRLKAVVLDGAKIIEKTIIIPISRPVVQIITPSEGGIIPAASFSARAIPYFFSITNPEELTFTWTANGSSVNDEGTPNVITVDASGGASGNLVNLSVRAINLSAVIESAQNMVTLRIR